MDTFKQGISVKQTNHPAKMNMEEGQFSLMRKVFKDSVAQKRNNAGSTLNLSFSDNSSYIARKKAIAIGKQNKGSVSYMSYDPVYVNHVIRKQHSSGAVVPKKSIALK
jgi:hypothetical protein